jgi:hypothetical protein
VRTVDAEGDLGMSFEAVVSFTQWALTPEALEDAGATRDFLRGNGWKEAGSNSAEGDRWSRGDVPLVTAFNRAASSGRGAAVGLVVRVGSDAEADDVRHRLLAHIAPLQEQGVLRRRDGDEVWDRWTDGDRVVLLGRLPATTLDTKEVPASVQLAVERTVAGP